MRLHSSAATQQHLRRLRARPARRHDRARQRAGRSSQLAYCGTSVLVAARAVAVCGTPVLARVIAVTVSISCGDAARISTGKVSNPRPGPKRLIPRMATNQINTKATTVVRARNAHRVNTCHARLTSILAICSFAIRKSHNTRGATWLAKEPTCRDTGAAEADPQMIAAPAACIGYRCHDRIANAGPAIRPASIA